jgi:DNA-binding MarR family transcriptional regulator
MTKAVGVCRKRETKASESAFRSLVRTCGLLRRVQEPYFQRLGISGAQWGVLRVLYQAEETGRPGLRLAEVGQRLLIRPPSVTGVVDRLERMGLVSRQAVPEDLRARHVQLTAQGRQLLERSLVSHLERTQSLMAGLSEAEQASLGAALDKLCAHMATMAPAEITVDGE